MQWLYDVLPDRFSEQAMHDYLTVVIEQDEICGQTYSDGPAFSTNIWKDALKPKRYLISGFTAHGFHFLWCNNTFFHEQKESCSCRFCLQTTCDRQHALTCEYVINHTPSQALSEVHSLLILKNVTIDE